MHLAFEMQIVQPLHTLQSNRKAIIAHVQHTEISPKLVEMGFIPGSEVSILFRAPFGGPLAIDLGSSVVSLRIEEAQVIMIDASSNVDE